MGNVGYDNVTKLFPNVNYLCRQAVVTLELGGLFCQLTKDAIKNATLDQIQSLVHQFETSVPTEFVRQLTVVHQIIQDNSWITSYTSDWRYVMREAVDTATIFTASIFFGNCSIATYATCSQSVGAYDNETFVEFHIGCFPVEALLQSSISCLFNSTCVKLLDLYFPSLNASDPIMTEIEQRIHSLQLSNEFYHDQIEKFLSWFSLIEFSHLQALSLIGVDEYDVGELKSILSRLPKLLSFRLIDFSHIGEELLSTVQITELHRLEILQPLKDVKLISKQSTITYLKLFNCNLYNLYKILQSMPLLKSLNLQNVFREYPSKQRNSLQITKLIYLKQMILMEFEYSFEDLEFFVSHTPNLQYLTITNYGDVEMIDAIRWERFITSSLPHLTNFHFLFSAYATDDIIQQFERFQSAFWFKQHHWYTDSGFNEIAAVIHTIPYILNEYVLHSCPIQYQLDNLNRFEKVRKLSLYNGLNSNQVSHYFSNLTSLEWHRQSMSEDNMSNERDLKYLFRIVNVASLEHFSMYNNSSDDINLILLEVLKRAPRLTSLSFRCFNWKTLFQDEQLCLYLNQRIRVLNGQYYQLYMADDIEQFCQVFYNLEQLKCQLCKREHLLYLLNNLPHLSVLKVIVFKSSHRKNLFRWLKKAPRLNVPFLVEERFSSDEKEKVCIWIGRNIDKTLV